MAEPVPKSSARGFCKGLLKQVLMVARGDHPASQCALPRDLPRDAIRAIEDHARLIMREIDRHEAGAADRRKPRKVKPAQLRLVVDNTKRAEVAHG